jgi:hypothetical protein
MEMGTPPPPPPPGNDTEDGGFTEEWPVFTAPAGGGDPEPVLCPVGAYLPPGGAACVACDAGAYCPAGATMQVECGAGFFCGFPGLRLPCDAWTQAGGGRATSALGPGGEPGPGVLGDQSWALDDSPAGGWDPFRAWPGVTLGPGGVCSCKNICLDGVVEPPPGPPVYSAPGA